MHLDDGQHPPHEDSRLKSGAKGRHPGAQGATSGGEREQLHLGSAFERSDGGRAEWLGVGDIAKRAQQY